MPISQLRSPASVQAAGNGRGWQVRRAVCTRRILGRFGSGYAGLMTSETQVAAGTAGLSDGEPGAVIHTEDLTKVYGGTDFAAVDKLNLDVEVGEIFGLLGPNGAGKTTTAGMLTTRVVPTSGRAFIAGVDVAAHPALAKQLSGIVSQQNTLDRQLTVWENLYFHGRLFGIKAKESRKIADELLDAVPAVPLGQGVGVRAVRRHGPAAHGGPGHLPPPLGAVP